MGAALAMGGSVVYQASSGCGGFALEGALSAVDFCAIVDCQSGGGVISLCGSPNSTADDVLADCPNFDNAGGG